MYNMYREKQLSQIAFFEEMQKKCTVNDVSEAIEIGRNILSIAKKIDEQDAAAEENELKEKIVKVKKKLDGEALYEAVKQLNDEYEHNQKSGMQRAMERMERAHSHRIDRSAD